MFKPFEIVKKIANRYLLDRNVARYIFFNKKKWWRDPDEQKNSIILLDRFDLNPVIHCFSYIANYMAKVTDSKIVTFHFTRSLLTRVGIPERRLEKIYNSFGAKLGLSLEARLAKPFEEDADRFLENVYSKVKTKQDLVDLKIEDLRVGDFVYDSYLRKGKYTADLGDPKLGEYVRDAYLIYRICKNYLDTHNVKAVLTSHTVYNSHGILSRLAIQRGIPLYYIINLDNLTIQEVKTDVYYLREYHKYRTTFAELPESKKPGFRAEASKILTDRFDGKIDWALADTNLVNGQPGSLGYGPFSKGSVLRKSGRAKVLVLLHCFFDSPHIYNQMLFPDFWEWINFLLETASKTDFDWYVKPHPGGRAGNSDVIEILRKKFPQATFLDQNVSNRQIMEEGLNAMFTVHGSAAHEFAYKNIPVVTAGDNPQINYDFNIHASTIPQYKQLILKADNLKIDIKKSDIEEFFYMHNIYVFRKSPISARIMNEENSYHKLGHGVNKTSVFSKYLGEESVEKDKCLESYFDFIFSPSLGSRKKK